MSQRAVTEVGKSAEREKKRMLEGKEDSMGLAKSNKEKDSEHRRRNGLGGWFGHSTGWYPKLVCQKYVDSQWECSINQTLQNMQSSLEKKQQSDYLKT